MNCQTTLLLSIERVIQRKKDDAAGLAINYASAYHSGRVSAYEEVIHLLKELKEGQS